ncbi:hypothetical protein, partial [Ideonella sp. B508-1]|uniref:hypothetical protein n=1 Tax=Ideonella sp. B508-1 TaxID=137716 RepID=UPI000477866E
MKQVEPWDDAPFRPVRLGPIDCEVQRGGDGTLRMRLKEPLGPYPRRYTERLLHWAEATPDAVFLARRPPA